MFSCLWCQLTTWDWWAGKSSEFSLNTRTLNSFNLSHRAKTTSNEYNYCTIPKTVFQNKQQDQLSNLKETDAIFFSHPHFLSSSTRPQDLRLGQICLSVFKNIGLIFSLQPLFHSTGPSTTTAITSSNSSVYKYLRSRPQIILQRLRILPLRADDYNDGKQCTGSTSTQSKLGHWFGQKKLRGIIPFRSRGWRKPFKQTDQKDLPVLGIANRRTV